MSDDPDIDDAAARRTAETTFAEELDRIARDGSPLDQQIARHVTDHLQDEAGLLAEYEQIAAESDHEHIRYLIGLVVEDERRHHQLLISMLHRLSSDAALVEVPGSVPRLGPTIDSPELRDVTKELLAAERRDAQDLKRLRAELRSRRETTLFGLILELMELDTQKHLRILSFIRDHIDG